jgi:predicted component of type VI protein secretion system
MDCILGNKVWDTANGIEIVIGPLNLEDYMKFLPKQTSIDREVSPLQEMREIVGMYVPKGVEIKLRFYLGDGFKQGIYLIGGSRLNKDSFE